MIIEGTSLDNAVHIATVVVSLALFALSTIAYARSRKAKFLYICAAFLLFAIGEIITTYSILIAPAPFLVGISHILTFAVLILFFIGVIK
jgi:hypothetical protein